MPLNPEVQCPKCVPPAGGGGDPLSLACRFFDRGLAGYLEDDDLEEIGYMVADNLSSALLPGLRG